MSELASAPIRRRKRIRHQTTLVQRLLARAEEARVIAARLMGGPEREALLQRAEQAEAAAEIATDLLPSRSLGTVK
jgi:hypothetical protein